MLALRLLEGRPGVLLSRFVCFRIDFGSVDFRIDFGSAGSVFTLFSGMYSFFVCVLTLKDKNIVSNIVMFRFSHGFKESRLTGKLCSNRTKG
jgi:hypothetical protein